MALATFHCQISSRAVVLGPHLDEEQEAALKRVCLWSLRRDLPCTELLLPFTNCLNMHLTLICERFTSVSGLLQSLLPCLPARLYLNLTLGFLGTQRSLQPNSPFSKAESP